MQQTGEIILYQPDENVQLEVRLEEETVWLTQAQMSLLFETSRNNITLHIGNIFKEGELIEDSVCKESLLTASDGKSYKTKIYNLDIIISVGYRVKSRRGTQFRIWANKILKDYLIKGYAVNTKISQQKFDDLKKLVNVLGRTVKAQEQLTSDDATALINVVTNYNYALDTCNALGIEIKCKL